MKLQVALLLSRPYLNKLSENIALLWSCWARKDLLRCPERKHEEYVLIRADLLDLDRMLLAKEEFCRWKSGETSVLLKRVTEELLVRVTTRPALDQSRTVSLHRNIL